MRAARLAAAVLLAGAGLAVAPPAAGQDAATGPASLNPLSALDLESLAATRTLPLFTPSRSAPVVEQPVPEIVAVEPEVYVAPEPMPPALRLVGVVMTESDRVALLADAATGTIHRLRAGETYDGWTLSIVDGRTVEFLNEGRQHTLKMFEEFGAQPPNVDPLIIPEPDL